MRGEAQDEAELVSQALMGTPMRVQAADGEWRRCVSPDGYSGWVRAGDLAAPKDGFLSRPRWVVWSRFASPRPLPKDTLAPFCALSVGTLLPAAEAREGWTGLELPDGRVGWVESRFLRAADPAAPPPSGEDLLRKARELLGTPYLWGGTSALGIDCSGFAQLVFALHGITLPRDAHLQCAVGREVERQELLPADLVFFGGPQPGSRVSHVGLYSGAGRFLHASSSGGVMESLLGEAPYEERYWGARRMLGPARDSGAARSASASAAGARSGESPERSDRG